MPACLFKKKKKAVTALSCVNILVKQVARLQSPQLIKVTKAEKANETQGPDLDIFLKPWMKGGGGIIV